MVAEVGERVYCSFWGWIDMRLCGWIDVQEFSFLSSEFVSCHCAGRAIHCPGRLGSTLRDVLLLPVARRLGPLRPLIGQLAGGS